MIVTEKHNPENKRKVAEILSNRGYISTIALTGLPYEKLDELSISSRILNDKKNIKSFFEQDSSPYMGICVDYGGKSKRYWYRISDLQKIYPIKYQSKFIQ